MSYTADAPAIESGENEVPRQRDLRVLRPLLGYLRPYRSAVVGALIALVVAAATVLAMGQGLRALIDRGFRSGDEQLLDQALLVLLAVIVVLALASYTAIFPSFLDRRTRGGRHPSRHISTHHKAEPRFL